jgi:hypothetical protein
MSEFIPESVLSVTSVDQILLKKRISIATKTFTVTTGHTSVNLVRNPSSMEEIL